MVSPVIVLVVVDPKTLSTKDKLLELVPLYTHVSDTPLPIAAVQLKVTWLVLVVAERPVGAATFGVALAVRMTE